MPYWWDLSPRWGRPITARHQPIGTSVLHQALTRVYQSHSNSTGAIYSPAMESRGRRVWANLNRLSLKKINKSFIVSLTYRLGSRPYEQSTGEVIWKGIWSVAPMGLNPSLNYRSWGQQMWALRGPKIFPLDGHMSKTTGEWRLIIDLSALNDFMYCM